MTAANSGRTSLRIDGRTPPRIRRATSPTHRINAKPSPPVRLSHITKSRPKCQFFDDLKILQPGTESASLTQNWIRWQPVKSATTWCVVFVTPLLRERHICPIGDLRGSLGNSENHFSQNFMGHADSTKKHLVSGHELEIGQQIRLLASHLAKRTTLSM
jgi:D-serine deaminase-like pyridoxal phosphate-dependent protein